MRDGSCELLITSGERLFSNIKISPEKPILIAGPTASGKSALALKLAREHNGIIINADALQVYDCWQILTARPSTDDLAKAPHALYGHVARTESYSVGRWLRELEPYIDGSSGKTPIIVGGTGLYFSSLLNGLANIPNVTSEVRSRGEHIVNKNGISALLSILRQHDPDTVSRIDTQNPMRVQRAWEVLETTGKGLASWQDQTPEPRLRRADCNAFLLSTPKEVLTPRINSRFRRMLDLGAVDECRRALPDWDPTLPSSRAIGAREIISYLRDETDLDTAITGSEIATRQYAKRQRSWFKARMKDWIWIDANSPSHE